MKLIHSAIIMSFFVVNGANAAEGFAFNLHAAAKPLPAISFQDAAGTEFTLNDFAGKLVLLNIWATWCAPCRKELPDLEALQKTLGGDTFEVVTLSNESGQRAKVQKLFDELGIDQSQPFIEETGSLMRKFGVFAMPTTLLISPEGQEIGRKLGPADWDNASALAFFEAQIKSASVSN